MFFLFSSPSIQSPSALRNVCLEFMSDARRRKENDKKREASLFPSCQQFTVTISQRYTSVQNRINSTKQQTKPNKKAKQNKQNIEHNN